MRGNLLFALGALASVTAMGMYAEHAGMLAKKPAPVQSPREVAALTTAQTKECRDQCEQRVLVEHLGDEEIPRCRARCEHEGPVTRPYEPVTSVTRAPADHHLDHPPHPPIIVGPARAAAQR